MDQETKDRIISVVVKGIYEDYPELTGKFGERGKRKCEEDNRHHFDHLDTCLTMNNDQMFVDYALWLNGILTARGMETKHLIDNFERIDRAIAHEGTENQEDYMRLLRVAISTINKVPQ